MMTSFINNKDKIYSFLKDDVGGSSVRSCARSHDPRPCNYGVRPWQVTRSLA